MISHSDSEVPGFLNDYFSKNHHVIKKYEILTRHE